ncbi:helix-turn-helix transcriptional regulator [Shewanella japonica]|uniref:helix-turn-helix transcriptional regulator n=1 Tax=Shewanella japonica TaxID=93973 RepID=UPI000E75506B|nr:helix-turn-helix transcriptional regulator [Shewanella japonica]
MIKYKCRPAIHTKLVCEYCNSIDFHLPVEFAHFKYFNDTEWVGINIITKLLNYIENNTEDPYFFLNLAKYFVKRVTEFTKIDLSDDVDIAQKLIDFTMFYSQVSDLNWVTIDAGDYIGLVAKRNPIERASKYDDLFVYLSVMQILNFHKEINSNIIIELPFERGFYGYNVAILENVKFNCQNLSIFAKKTPGKQYDIRPLCIETITSLDRIHAAAKSMIPAELSVDTLAIALGMSTRSLQREVKSMGLCVKDIIKEVKANRLKLVLKKNQDNIKVTAYECGFKSLAIFSRHFSNNVGCCPSEYVSRINDK